MIGRPNFPICSPLSVLKFKKIYRRISPDENGGTNVRGFPKNMERYFGGPKQKLSGPVKIWKLAPTEGSPSASGLLGMWTVYAFSVPHGQEVWAMTKEPDPR